MKTKNSIAKKNIVEGTVKNKGKIAERTQAIEKPLGAEKLRTMKKNVEKVRITKDPVVTEKPDADGYSAPPARPQAKHLGIRKKYIASRNICEVTFRLPSEASLKARKVTVVGDFNNWEKDATPLEKQENGDFTATLELDAGKEYRFRYLIDGQRWENDWHADKYVKSPYDVEDSVVCAHV
jgi:hypothetical protein